MSPAPGPQARDRLFDGYRPREGAFDEVLTPAGELHPHYETFMASLEAMGRHELSFRRDNARRAIRDDFESKFKA